MNLAEECKALADGKRVPGVATTRCGYRRVSVLWLAHLADTVERHESQMARVKELLEDLLGKQEGVNDLSIDDEIAAENCYRDLFGESPWPPDIFNSVV